MITPVLVVVGSDPTSLAYVAACGAALASVPSAVIAGLWGHARGRRSTQTAAAAPKPPAGGNINRPDTAVQPAYKPQLHAGGEWQVGDPSTTTRYQQQTGRHSVRSGS